MDNVLNGHGLGLAYVNDPKIIEKLDQEEIFEDLAEGAYDALVFRPERWRLADHDHLVLARANRSGRYLGLLAASTDDSGGVPFLNIDTVFIAPEARELDLFQRMLALVVLRMEGVESAPSVITACTGSSACMTALRQVAACCPGAVLFPQTDSPLVSLGTASLARRLAMQIVPRCPVDLATGRVQGHRPQTLGVLDLRACPPETVVEAARGLCRTRPSRAALRAALGEPALVRRAAKS